MEDLREDDADNYINELAVAAGRFALCGVLVASMTAELASWFARYNRRPPHNRGYCPMKFQEPA
ncbi:hypothetical protein A9513_021390 [Pseudomonas sp. AU12215]|nr:hypothetical protein A9513_021390 [Pseudomonas sp. AU12215]